MAMVKVYQSTSSWSFSDHFWAEPSAGFDEIGPTENVQLEEEDVASWHVMANGNVISECFFLFALVA